MAIMPYNADRDVLDYEDSKDQTLEPDRAVANDNGSSLPPSPKPYQPYQPASDEDQSRTQAPTFSQLQAQGEARPPMPEAEAYQPSYGSVRPTYTPPMPEPPPQVAVDPYQDMVPQYNDFWNGSGFEAPTFHGFGGDTMPPKDAGPNASELLRRFTGVTPTTNGIPPTPIDQGPGGVVTYTGAPKINVEPPTPFAAAPIPANQTTPGSTPGTIATMTGDWTPPTAAAGSAPLIQTTAGGTMTPQGDAANSFRGYQTDQGGGFGGYDSAIDPNTGMTFKQYDDAAITNARKMFDSMPGQVPSLSRERFDAMSQADNGAEKVKAKLARGEAVTPEELAFYGMARGTELQGGGEFSRLGEWLTPADRAQKQQADSQANRQALQDKVLGATFVPGVGSATMRNDTGDIVLNGQVIGNIDDPNLDIAAVRSKALELAKNAERPQEGNGANWAEAQKLYDAAQAPGGFWENPVTYADNGNGQFVPESEIKPYAPPPDPRAGNWTAKDPALQQELLKSGATAADVGQAPKSTTPPVDSGKTTSNPNQTADPNTTHNTKTDPNVGTKVATIAGNNNVANQTVGTKQYQTSTANQNARAVQESGTPQFDVAKLAQQSRNLVAQETQPQTGGSDELLSMLMKGASGQGAGSEVQEATNKALLEQFKNPSAYGLDQVKQAYDWLGGSIDDQYAVEQQKLGEEMAKRGLSISTIFGGRLSDLNIGKRSAKESMAYDLAQKLAETTGQGRSNAIAQGLAGATTAQGNQLDWIKNLMGYGQQGFENDMTSARFNADQDTNYQDFLLKMLGMGYGG